ncbi:MAG: hypothetical protein L3J95_05405 [Thermoplasmata archaeon]|nr:hypothetical protein [Thermoplasmata archaeon]MCI4359837.1 hypothetical protein [Thermoplasmata archaeon]
MKHRAEAQEERSARAFAPGHITGIFSPAQSSEDPRARGSIGAGLVLDAGVRATARLLPTGRRQVRLASDLPIALPISLDVARRLFAGHDGSIRVELTHELPVGQGLGMSAAGALSTALSVASVLGLPRRKAIEVAHLADLFGGGGLGGVSAILGGGLELRERPGVPPIGRARHWDFRPSVFVSVVGPPVPSPILLASPAFLERVRRAAGPGLRRLASKPEAKTFLRVSEQFTDALSIGPPKVRRILSRLRSTGTRVAQAMFGQSLFSVPGSAAQRTRFLRELERSRIPSVELKASPSGAHLLR